MTLDPAGMTVDVVRAEASRFRHPLLLLHGLWTGGWIWRELAPYLAHRGWDAWVPSFLPSDRPAMHLGERRRSLLALCGELPEAPIVIAHDAGLVVADELGRDVATPATVAIAPLPRGASAFGQPQFWGARLGARTVRPPHRRAARALLAGLGDDDLVQLRPDSGSLLRAVTSRADGVASRGGAGLVVCSPNDAATVVGDCGRLAKSRRWAREVHQTPGHFPMLGPSATGLADRVHRWLVRTLGGDLLAWIEEEEGEE